MVSAGSYDDFFSALRQRESSGDYTVVNRLGYAGAYQFGEAALFDLGYAARDGNLYNNHYDNGFLGKNGIDSLSDFLEDSDEQDGAASAWFAMLWSRIRASDLEFYDGQTLNGVALTKSGMIAAAHLAGTGGLKNFIESGGVTSAKDGNGTSVVDYLKLFAGYETPSSFLNNLDKDNDLFGGSGNDRFAGAGGDDDIHGGGGIDTAVYAGLRSDYDVFAEDGVLTVDGDGIDRLFAIERLQFANGTLAFDRDGTAGQAYRIYQAAFDRIPDAGGLSHWIATLDSGVTLLQVAADFLGSAEFRSTYGTDLANDDYIAALYDNVLGRTGETAGMDYWVDALDDGASRAIVLADFSESAENVARVAPAINDGIFFA